MVFKNTCVYNIYNAILGARNPYDSWDKSDSKIDENGLLIIGNNDLQLAQKLIKAGSEHRKFLRQIFVSVDITAPLYWWKEFDTYKIGTVSNSCSTMHTLSKKPITIDMFEMGDFNDVLMGNDVVEYRIKGFWQAMVAQLEALREKYNQTKNKMYWKELIRLLPESFLQKRTITMNYENILSMCKQRKGHKLVEWKSFIDWVSTLPYSNELIFIGDNRIIK